MSNQKKLVPIIPFNKVIHHAFILLDTNILIGLGLEQEAYIDLFTLLDRQECSYFTTDLCKWEFIRGSANKKIIKDKEALFSKLDIGIVPIANLYKEFLEIQCLFRLSGKDISIADLFLAAVLKKYMNTINLFLITEDIKAFPRNFFGRKLILNIDHGQIQPLLFCQLNTSAYSQSIKTF